MEPESDVLTNIMKGKAKGVIDSECPSCGRQARIIT
jgi:hypothetical protein